MSATNENFTCFSFFFPSSTSFFRTSARMCVCAPICRAYLCERSWKACLSHTHTHKLKSAINWWAQTDWKEIKQSRVEPSWWQFIVHTCNWWWCLGDQANTNVCHVCVRMRVCICQGIFHCLAVPKSRLYKLPAIILRLCQYSKIYWRYIAI